MIESYIKILEMESIISLKLEQDRKNKKDLVPRKRFYCRKINKILQNGIRYRLLQI